jgi:hypothetical protein
VRRCLALLCLLVVVPLLPCAPPPTPMLDAELGVPLGAPLVSVATKSPPVLDGIVDSAWERASPLSLPLHYGLHGDEPAGEMELHSLYDDQNVYFLARWPAEAPGGEPDVWRNLLTVHWRLVDPGLVSGESTGSDGLACAVACHTATADGQGRLIGIRSETIPPGLGDDLPNGGGWAQGRWALEWSRPRVSLSPYDQHMTDPAHNYRFFVKLFQGLEGRADPVSNVHELRLSR